MPDSPRFADARIAEAAPGVIQRGMTADLYLPRPESAQEHNLIDGLVYASPPPTERHEDVLLTLAQAIDGFARGHGGKVFVSRDCRLGDETVVQADIAYLSAERRGLAGPALRGAPDLIVEVMSSGTRAFDTEAKFAAYGKSGVLEAWFVDLATATVNVVKSDGTAWSSECTVAFGEVIPSAIVDVGNAGLEPERSDVR